MFVNEAMTTALVVCRPDSSLEEIACKMWQADCGAVPVVDDAGRPVGIVTDRDIAMGAMLNHRPLWEISAATITNGRPLHCCGQRDPIETCLAAMAEHSVRRMPVVDDAGKLVGIVSMSDALGLAPEGAGKKAPKLGADRVLHMLRKVATPHVGAASRVATI